MGLAPLRILAVLRRPHETTLPTILIHPTRHASTEVHAPQGRLAVHPTVNNAGVASFGALGPQHTVRLGGTRILRRVAQPGVGNHALAGKRAAPTHLLAETGLLAVPIPSHAPAIDEAARSQHATGLGLAAIPIRTGNTDPVPHRASTSRLAALRLLAVFVGPGNADAVGQNAPTILRAKIGAISVGQSSALPLRRGASGMLAASLRSMASGTIGGAARPRQKLNRTEAVLGTGRMGWAAHQRPRGRQQKSEHEPRSDGNEDSHRSSQGCRGFRTHQCILRPQSKGNRARVNAACRCIKASR